MIVSIHPYKSFPFPIPINPALSYSFKLNMNQSSHNQAYPAASSISTILSKDMMYVCAVNVHFIDTAISPKKYISYKIHRTTTTTYAAIPSLIASSFNPFSSLSKAACALKCSLKAFPISAVSFGFPCPVETCASFNF